MNCQSFLVVLGGRLLLFILPLLFFERILELRLELDLIANLAPRLAQLIVVSVVDFLAFVCELVFVGLLVHGHGLHLPAVAVSLDHVFELLPSRFVLFFLLLDVHYFVLGLLVDAGEDDAEAVHSDNQRTFHVNVVDLAFFLLLEELYYFWRLLRKLVIDTHGFTVVYLFLFL